MRSLGVLGDVLYCTVEQELAISQARECWFPAGTYVVLSDMRAHRCLHCQSSMRTLVVQLLLHVSPAAEKVHHCDRTCDEWAQWPLVL